MLPVVSGFSRTAGRGGGNTHPKEKHYASVAVEACGHIRVGPHDRWLHELDASPRSK